MKCKKGMKRPKEPKTPKVMKDMKMGKMGKMGKKGYDDDYTVDPPVSLPAPEPAPFQVQPNPGPFPEPAPVGDPFSCVGCTFGVVGSGCYDGAPSECYDNNCC